MQFKPDSLAKAINICIRRESYQVCMNLYLSQGVAHLLRHLSIGLSLSTTIKYHHCTRSTNKVPSYYYCYYYYHYYYYYYYYYYYDDDDDDDDDEEEEEEEDV